MAKKIEFKITLYSPKELWAMFWNRFFYPRRKQCAEWCEYYASLMDSKMIEIVGEARKNGVLSEEDANELISKLLLANTEAKNETKCEMCEGWKFV